MITKTDRILIETLKKCKFVTIEFEIDDQLTRMKVGGSVPHDVVIAIQTHLQRL